jgi:predicted metal-dependent enzyme (double-stranded beta helix superfamily)
MSAKDWFATNTGQLELWELEPPTQDDYSTPYRLYRFLTELEDTLAAIEDDQLRLRAIYPLVRRLLQSAEWLQVADLQPDPKTGWDLTILYDEPFFPLTVQLVAWAPGTVSEIHNHGTWGLVALLNGQEKNTFWQQPTNPELAQPPQGLGPLKTVGDCLLQPGDILGMMPNTIHQIEALGNEPSLSFNLYGEALYEHRFEFEPTQGTATPF